MSLKGKTILVTNAGDGVGLACAHALAAAGAGIVFSAGDDESVRRVEGELQMHGVPIYGLMTDTARSREVESLLGEALRVFGDLNGAIVVPATLEGGSLLETDDADLDRSLTAGVRAAFLICQRAARIMVGRGHGGHLVLVDPAVAGGGAAAALTRDALAGLAGALATELSPHEIRVNAVVGGTSVAQVTAVAALVVFLAGDRAATVSGAVIDLGAAPGA